MVKSELFTQAIKDRSKVRFMYSMEEVVLDPYFILYEGDGSKAVYGKTGAMPALKKFEFKRIVNLKVMPFQHFVPEVPATRAYN